MPTQTLATAQAPARYDSAQRSFQQKLAWEHAKQAAYTVPVDMLRFGIELECYLPIPAFNQLGLTRGQYHAGLACPPSMDLLGCGWTCERDASLERQAPSPNHIPCEFVSPPLTGLAGFIEVERFVDLLAASGAVVTRACGLHVNVGLEEIVGAQVMCDERRHKFLRRLQHLVSIHENSLLQIGGKHSRVNNRYCVSIKADPEVGRLTIRQPLADFTQMLHFFWGRYRTLNLVPSIGQDPRVEFRVFAATVNSTKVLGYIGAALGLVHKAAEAPIAQQLAAGETALSAVLSDGTATARLHAALWLRGAGPKYGIPQGVWAKWGSRILKNQRWNAKSFLRRVPSAVEDEDAS